MDKNNRFTKDIRQGAHEIESSVSDSYVKVECWEAFKSVCV